MTFNSAPHPAQWRSTRLAAERSFIRQETEQYFLRLDTGATNGEMHRAHE